MQALALAIDRPPPRRRRKSGGPWILLVSTAAHLLVLGGLIVGMRVAGPVMVEPPTLSVELLRPATPPKTSAPPKPVTHAARPAPLQSPPVATPAIKPAPPSVPTQALAPPGFKARELIGGGGTLREAARDGIGCRNADELALTKAERAACAEKLGEQNKNRPAMYAVIDPDKKAAFDGACKKDDDWCLYRTGKGPYPGIFALGKKKKIKGWD